jgi:hypothetical protein
VDDFKGTEWTAKFRGRDIYPLIRTCFPDESRCVTPSDSSAPDAGSSPYEVRAEFSIEAMQNVQIERCGEANLRGIVSVCMGLSAQVTFDHAIRASPLGSEARLNKSVS